ARESPRRRPVGTHRPTVPPKDVVPLKDVVETLHVGLPVSRYAAKTGEGRVSAPVLSVGDIEAGRIAPVAAISTVQLRAADVERFRVHANDVVVSCRGIVFKAAVVSHDAEGVVASSNIIIVRPKKTIISPQLLLTLFRSPEWQDALKARNRSA